jgi:YfiH family protein
MTLQSFKLNKLNHSTFDNIEMPVKKVQAFQTTRLHPNLPTTHSSLSSSNCFEHFNLGLHVFDDSEVVLKNRQQLLTYLPEKSAIQWLDQVHGNNVVVAEHISASSIQADAVITRSPKLALAIMTADCLPILLCNSQGTEIAAIHAGWRSLVSGIIAETLTKMLSDNSELYAWLGPCISQNNFEVGVEVKNQFEGINPSFSLAFKQSNKSSDKEKWLADLQQIAQQQLSKLHVNNIVISNHCTFGENERYYSYRKEQKTGRMASIICIK